MRSPLLHPALLLGALAVGLVLVGVPVGGLAPPAPLVARPTAPRDRPAGARRLFSAEDRAHWSFQPLSRPAVPRVRATGWVRNPVDAFVLARLEAAGREPRPPADRRSLARRLSLDLHGLPPDPDRVDAFVRDRTPAAYERLVDELLASPRYGEQWGRHWLDLVRYADSDGYRADAYRPLAWKYRDWVIGSLNEDKPYDRFVIEQLAGDEAQPGNPAARIATGYLRLWPYESNQRDVQGQWRDILNDITDVTGEVFLGLGLRCARCHDHKFDPILRRDYFRLRAFFAAVLPRDDLVAASPRQRRDFEARRERWLESTREIRARIEAFERPHLERLARPAFEKFSGELQELLRAPVEELGPYERQIRHLAHLQIEMETRKLPGSLRGETRAEWDGLQKELDTFRHLRPVGLPPVLGVVDVGPEAPPTSIPDDPDREDILPGFLTILGDPPPAVRPPAAKPDSTGRRLALARWMTRPDNPLATRVIVNRLWQHHFGRGLVATPNDFGRRGARPSAPGLLDWLATELPRRGWSLKTLHRLLVTSSTYRQRVAPGDAEAGDPAGKLQALEGFRGRRLLAEEIRDAMLVTSGELALAMGGPGVGEDAPRRSAYLRIQRNAPPRLISAFDGPDNFNSCAVRDVTTTSTQALLLLNGDWCLGRARAFARRVLAGAPHDPVRQVELAYRLALGRLPSGEDSQRALGFLGRQLRLIHTGGECPPPEEAAREALADLCHVLLNTNEFIHVD